MNQKKTDIAINNLVNDYLNSNESEKIVGHYILTTHVRPKNIYTDKTDFVERYKQELILLCKIFKVISLPKDIGEQIPEIKEFFPLTLDSLETFKSNMEDSVSFIIAELNNYLSFINAREYGEYYSSTNLINILLDNLKIKFTTNLKVIDPSSGTGYFLFHYLSRILQENKLDATDINNLRLNLYGYDIFPFPIIISKLLLGKLLEGYNTEIRKPYEFANIRIQNTLKTLVCNSNNNEKFDLILGNPPYFRIDPHEDNNICKCVSFGHNYVHNLFLHWAIQHLDNDGQLGLILPQSILSGYYYQKMRLDILNSLSIDLIVTNKDHEKSFSVQQDIMLFVGTKKSEQSKYYKIGVSNSQLTKLNYYSVDSRIMINSLSVIPLFKNKTEYNNFIYLVSKSIVHYLSSFSIHTGNFVWNQNKNICYSHIVPQSIPLINGPNITLNGISLNNKRNTTFPYCIPDKKKYIFNEKLILYRRMSPIGNEKRMIAAIIDKEDYRFNKGYALENHVNFIRGPIEHMEHLLSFITSRRFNTLINSFCHTNQVSSNDLITIFELLISYNND